MTLELCIKDFDSIKLSDGFLVVKASAGNVLP